MHLCWLNYFLIWNRVLQIAEHIAEHKSSWCCSLLSLSGGRISSGSGTSYRWCKAFFHLGYIEWLITLQPQNSRAIRRQVDVKIMFWFLLAKYLQENSNYGQQKKCCQEETAKANSNLVWWGEVRQVSNPERIYRRQLWWAMQTPALKSS